LLNQARVRCQFIKIFCITISYAFS
jgi:hypothetical protein